MRPKPSFSVELVTPATVSDFLSIYRVSFPPNHQDPIDNIRAYADECGKWIQGSKRRSLDLLLLARDTSTAKPAGIAVVCVYEHCPWGFISWLAVDETFHSQGPLRALSRSILARLQEFEWVSALVFELEEANPARRDITHHRTRLFQRAGAKRVDLTYYQPSLDITDTSRTPERMHLMLLPLPGRRPASGLSLTYAEAVDLLNFVYLEFYLDTYVGTPIANAYEHHVTDLRDRVVSSLAVNRPVSVSAVRLPKATMPEVFVSQSSPYLAYRIHDRLFAEGVMARFWERHAKIGAPAWKRIFEMMKRATCVLVILTPRELSHHGLRPGILREVQWARRNQKPLLPLLSTTAKNTLRAIQKRHAEARSSRLMREVCKFLGSLTWTPLHQRDIDRTLERVTPRLWEIVDRAESAAEQRR